MGDVVFRWRRRERPSGMEVLRGFSTRMWIPAEESWIARGTWVWFGVQIMAAVGLRGEERRASMLEKWVVLREAAREGPWGAGSTRAMRVVFGEVMTAWACRGPMMPPPMMAIVMGWVVGDGMVVDVM